MHRFNLFHSLFFQFTGSQESILQMDLDVGEDEDLDDTRDSNPSRGISPLPQIRMVSGIVDLIKAPCL